MPRWGSGRPRRHGGCRTPSRYPAPSVRPRDDPTEPEPGSRAIASEVLPGPGRSDALDGPAPFDLFVVGEEDPQIDDPLALLARDLGPVVRVGGVGQVLVLLVLLADGPQQVVGADAAALARDLPLDGELLGPADDVLDHGAGGEVLEVEDLFVAVLIGDLDEAVVV